LLTKLGALGVGKVEMKVLGLDLRISGRNNQMNVLKLLETAFTALFISIYQLTLKICRSSLFFHTRTFEVIDLQEKK